MEYKSKLYVCKRIKIGKEPYYNEMLAAMNMSNMDSDFVRLFDKKLDGDFFGMDRAMSRFDQQEDDNEPKLADNYGDDLKYTSLDRVLSWCDEYMDNTDEFPYWRIAVLQEMLASFDIYFQQLYNEQLIVVHYGY